MRGREKTESCVRTIPMILIFKRFIFQTWIVNNGRKAKEKNLICLKTRGFCLKKEGFAFYLSFRKLVSWFTFHIKVLVNKLNLLLFYHCSHFRTEEKEMCRTCHLIQKAFWLFLACRTRADKASHSPGTCACCDAYTLLGHRSCWQVSL